MFKSNIINYITIVLERKILKFSENV